MQYHEKMHIHIRHQGIFCYKQAVPTLQMCRVLSMALNYMPNLYVLGKEQLVFLFTVKAHFSLYICSRY